LRRVGNDAIKFLIKRESLIMRTKLILMAASLILINLIGWGVYAQRQSRSATSSPSIEQKVNIQWEYKIEGANDTINAQKMLDKAGTEGWELVSTQSVTGGNQGVRFANIYFFFKRPKR
jgi:hypothetical protein